jgi:hypothetical protein
VTDWRAAPVMGFVQLEVSKQGPLAQMNWSTLPDARAYDVTPGELTNLLSSGCDFTVASGGCFLDDRVPPTCDDPDPPDPGRGSGILSAATAVARREPTMWEPTPTITREMRSCRCTLRPVPSPGTPVPPE